MPQYRKALKRDAERIAHLHAVNWQQNYRGILDDHYLDHEVIVDRKNVWRDRLKNPKQNMCLIVAEEGSKLIGFGCVFLSENLQYGAYLDNLHVSDEFSGRGIGKTLMSLLALEILERSDRNDMYLWVLTDNKGAIRFYEKLRGQRKEEVMEQELGNIPVMKVRFYWPNVTDLISHDITSDH